ncbi:MAG TPA: hypothetical protein VMN99_02535 [Anaerolineales bacterium]|nr:hypothetical protein [Anaerolineales bacterium]
MKRRKIYESNRETGVRNFMIITSSTAGDRNNRKPASATTKDETMPRKRLLDGYP